MTDTPAKEYRSAKLDSDWLVPALGLHDQAPAAQVHLPTLLTRRVRARRTRSMPLLAHGRLCRAVFGFRSRYHPGDRREFAQPLLMGGAGVSLSRRCLALGRSSDTEKLGPIFLAHKTRFLTPLTRRVETPFVDREVIQGGRDVLSFGHVQRLRTTRHLGAVQEGAWVGIRDDPAATRGA